MRIWITSIGRGRVLSVGIMVALLVGMSALPAEAAAGTCVGGPGCFTTVQAAVDAAAPGSTIRIAPGTFRGGVTIAKSVRLIGAGADRTTIRGGGPVVTVTSTSSERPSVAISRLTLTGGSAHGDGVNAFGGGLFIPSLGNGALGARVVVTGVAIVGNATRPTTTSPSPSGVTCPVGDCPYAGTRGGGVASFGDLTVLDSVVRDNLAGGRASDANGGGIFSAVGHLTIKSSAVTGNGAVPKAIGRFAEGGGIFVESGALTVEDSDLRDNAADLTTSWPVRGQGTLIDMNANSGALHIGDGIPAVIDRTTMTGNRINTYDPAGEPVAFDAAMLVGDSHLTMRSSVIAHNSTKNVAKTADDVGSSGQAVELDGPGEISDTRITDNPVTSYSESSTAIATAGFSVYDFSDNPRQVTLTRVDITGNTAIARSPHGVARAQGGGITNNSLLSLTDVHVDRNAVHAIGPHATAQGGGIWNGVLLSGPPVRLQLHRTSVTRNRATTSPGGTAQGGGIFTTEPLTLDRSVIHGNYPDQCFGCPNR